MEASTVTLTPNGRLTEHIAHVDVRNAPRLSYRSASSGRLVSFQPMKLIITWQWSWSRGGWHLLEVKVWGRNGSHDLHTRFTNPDKAPTWVQDAVTMAAPALNIPRPTAPGDDQINGDQEIK